jgi:demethylmenaquinone methyltransferase/2-methoxy-6-polyprenyl-1,4-benzoquinol methylase
MLKPGNFLIELAYLRFLRLSVAWTALVFGSTEASRNCRDYFMDAIANFYTPEELSAILRLVGFDNVTCDKSIWGGMVGFHKAYRPLGAP